MFPAFFHPYTLQIKPCVSVYLQLFGKVSETTLKTLEATAARTSDKHNTRK